MILIRLLLCVLFANLILISKNVLIILLLIEGLFLSTILIIVYLGNLRGTPWGIFLPLVWEVVAAALGLALSVGLSRSSDITLVSGFSIV